jgi:pimeloyl-ACP methyl ester carboxylesterase
VPDVEARGVRFKVHLVGEGDPLVVLVHGIGIDNSSSQYFLLAPALSPRCTVVCYDLRGHGDSEVTGSGYTFSSHVEDLDALLHELALDGRAMCLVGTSLGGRIALEFALRFPERVDRIALLDSEMTDLREYLGGLTEAIRRGPKATEQALQAAWEQYLEDHTVDGGLDHDASLLKTFLQSRSEVRRTLRLVRRLRQLTWETSFIEDMSQEPPLAWDELPQIHCPVLALYGEQSAVLGTGRRLAETLPDCTLELVPDCGHFVIYKTDFVRAALQRFIVGELAPA